MTMPEHDPIADMLHAAAQQLADEGCVLHEALLNIAVHRLTTPLAATCRRYIPGWGVVTLGTQ